MVRQHLDRTTGVKVVAVVAVIDIGVDLIDTRLQARGGFPHKGVPSRPGDLTKIDFVAATRVLVFVRIPPNRSHVVRIRLNPFERKRAGKRVLGVGTHQRAMGLPVHYCVYARRS